MTSTSTKTMSSSTPLIDQKNDNNNNDEMILQGEGHDRRRQQQDRIDDHNEMIPQHANHDNDNDNDNDNAVTSTSGIVGGIGWSGSLVGKLNPEQNLGYRYSNPMKRYRLSSDVNSNNVDLPSNIQIQLYNRLGIELSTTLDIPINTSIDDLQTLVNTLLQDDQKQNDQQQQQQHIPYAFYMKLSNGDDIEMNYNTISEFIIEQNNAKSKDNRISTEQIISITYQPLAIYKVRPVSRCTDTLQGHSEAILHVSHAPCGNILASGGGDAMVRFWDVNTSLPKHATKNSKPFHKNHVLCTSWSSDNNKFASGDKNGVLIIWDPNTGLPSPTKHIQAHKQHITCIVWEPFHLSKMNYCIHVATSSKDSTIKIWNATTTHHVTTLSGHTDSVECIKWSGENVIYSASRDRTIKVWNAERYILIRTLTGHGHRINTLALSSDYILRTGPYCTLFNIDDGKPKENMIQKIKRYQQYPNQAKEDAIAIYNNYKKQTLDNNKDNNEDNNCSERLISGSDDFTMYLWQPLISKHPIKRLTGHQQIINHICYSPDSRYFVSASFDKKIKLWNGYSGDYISTCIGHVGSVYQVTFSPDSRYFISASKDSTSKLWDISSKTTNKMMNAKDTLPGHADEVYALDWNPNGTTVATGSKDRTIKIWKH